MEMHWLAKESLITRKLQHQSIHHKAEIEFINATNEELLDRLSKLVELAQVGMNKGKLHVTEYQLKVMSELLNDRKENV